MILYAALLLGVLHSLCFASQHSRINNPRIIQQYTSGAQVIALPTKDENTVFYMDVRRSLYIGGQEFLYHVDFKMTNTSLFSLENKCKINATFMGQVNGNLMVCGPNASKRICCKMAEENVEEVPRSLPEQLSPPHARANYNILITGKDVYSTIPRISNNAASTRTLFSKIYGKEPFLYTNSEFMRNPQFIKSLAVERKSQVQNKIFLFFMEDNIENRTMEQTVPMIAQMCKEENGSEKPDSRNMFSTALKTRLICGNQEEGQYYPFMKDIFFLESQDLIYGLFTNAWNHSAVCSYKVEDVELVFNTSDLLGSSRKDLKIRPGTCLPGSKRTPPETTDEAAKYPFLTSWVWPLGNQTVFQNLYHYKKLVVDEIKAADMQTYKVIILATAPPDNGSLHKVVEYDDGASNILELHPFKKTSNETNDILYLELDPSKADHVLYVGSANEVARVPLDDCSAYNNTCTSCLLARDPFCGWAEGKCQSILMKDSMKIIQNLTAGAMCYYEQGTTPEYQRVGSYRRPSNNNNVQPPSTYFLTCLAESEQATYWWEDGNGFKQSCTPNEGKCHLLFNKFGEYRCMAQEFSTKYIVSKYSYSMENSSARTQYSCIVVLLFSLYIVYYMV